MATTRTISMGVIIALLALAAETVVRTGSHPRTAPLASPMAARPAVAGVPGGSPGVDARLQKLLAGDYQAKVEAHPFLNGEEAPSAWFSIVVRHTPDVLIQVRGEAVTGDETTPLKIEGSAAHGRLSYTTSGLGEWLSEDYKDTRQVYNLFGLIDDLGLLADVLAAGTPARPAPSPDRRVTVLPDEQLVQRLLATREEVVADRSHASYTVTEAEGGVLEVLSRLVYEVGGNRYEVNSVTRISPANSRMS